MTDRRERDGPSPPSAVSVRAATSDELASVLGVLDAAALETDADRVRAAVEPDDVLVAVPDGDSNREAGSAATDAVTAATGDETVVGTLVLDGDEIANVAVRRRRRGQGIGTALVGAAAARRETLVAEFDADVRPFYDSLGFATEAVREGRYRGVLDPAESPE